MDDAGADTGEALDAAVGADAAVADASGGDAGGSWDASAGDAATGPMPLPSTVSVDLVGDYVLPAGDMATVVDPTGAVLTIHLDGNLRVAAGSTLELQTGLIITGTLTLESGASVVSHSPRGPFSSLYLSPTHLVCQGTAAAPAIIDGSDGELDMTMDQITCDYAVLTDAHIMATAPLPQHVSDVRALRGTGHRPNFFNVIGDGATTSEVVHSFFQGTQVHVSNLGFTLSELRASWLSVVLSSGRNGAAIACEGERDVAQDITFHDNVFSDYAMFAETSSLQAFIELDRDFGPIDLSGNFFAQGIPTGDRWTHAWDGVETAGCPGRSAYGGPLTYQPTLGAAPSGVGPR